MVIRSLHWVSWWSPSQQGEPTDLTQGRWGRGPRSVQDIPGQLLPQVEQKRGAHVVHEEGILWATGCVAQDEALDEPGGGDPTWVEVRTLVVDLPPHSALHPLRGAQCSPPDGLCRPLPLGCLPPAQRSSPPRLDADGCRDHKWLTSISSHWWPTLAPVPTVLKASGRPNLIASPGGISAGSESPSRRPGSSWLWLGKKVTWPEHRGSSWGPGPAKSSMSKGSG